MLNRQPLDETFVNMFTHKEYSKSYIFYACVIGKCNIIIDNEMKNIAAVKFNITHYDLTVNIKLLEKLPIIQRMGIMKHESLHIINRHIQRFKETGMDKNVNIACDCSINQFINPDHLPYNAVSFEYVEKLCKQKLKRVESAEYYYNKLNLNKSYPDEKSENSENSHEDWKESKGNIEVQNMTTDKIIEKCIEESNKMKGTLPKGIKNKIEIKNIKGMSWQHILNNIIKTTSSGKISSIKKPNRRYSSREDIKGTKRDHKFDILSILDVSSSVDTKDSISLLSEMKTIICNTSNLSKMTLIQVDVEAYKPEEITKKTKLINRKGSGGTRLFPAIIRAKKENIKYNCIVILTDGYLFKKDVDDFIEMKPRVPIFWVICKGGNKCNTILSKENCKRFSIFYM